MWIVSAIRPRRVDDLVIIAGGQRFSEYFNWNIARKSALKSKLTWLLFRASTFHKTASPMNGRCRPAWLMKDVF